MKAALANWHAALGDGRWVHGKKIYYTVAALGMLALVPIVIGLPDTDNRQILSVINTLQAAVIAAGFVLAAASRREIWRRSGELLAALQVETEAPREMIAIIQNLAQGQRRILRNTVLVDVLGFIYFSVMAMAMVMM